MKYAKSLRSASRAVVHAVLTSNIYMGVPAPCRPLCIQLITNSRQPFTFVDVGRGHTYLCQQALSCYHDVASVPRRNGNRHHYSSLKVNLQGQYSISRDSGMGVREELSKFYRSMKFAPARFYGDCRLSAEFHWVDTTITHNHPQSSTTMHVCRMRKW
jgi:hypothetical protein